MRYFDASALAKWYIEESDSEVVRGLLQAPAATSRLSSVEVPSAIIRRARDAGTRAEERDRALHAFEIDFADIMVVELTQDISALANDILRRQSLRAADAIHVASCLWLGQQLGADLSFVAFDLRLNDAAVAEGLALAP
jgi:predicted nucleic acid-binding protein